MMYAYASVAVWFSILEHFPIIPSHPTVQTNHWSSGRTRLVISFFYIRNPESSNSWKYICYTSERVQTMLFCFNEIYY